MTRPSKKAQPKAQTAASAVAPPEAQLTTRAQQRPKCWESFFHCQPVPVLRSQLLTTLMAGTPLDAARVPHGALLDAVLLAPACRSYHQAEIVDDYQGLLDRTEEEWRAPNWTARVFSSIHGNAASFILHGAREFSCAEEQYIPAMAAWYIQHDAPAYFARELSEEESVGRRTETRSPKSDAPKTKRRAPAK